VGAALLSGACGDDEPDGPRLSRSEFIAKGDELCRDMKARTRELSERDPKTYGDIQEIADKSLVEQDRTRKKLLELRPPAELEKPFDAYLDSLQDLVDSRMRISDAAQRGDEDVEARTQDSFAVEDDAMRQAGELGFRECSRL
jgi:hypothetical protein